jgi:hypothetical protein
MISKSSRVVNDTFLVKLEKDLGFTVSAIN